MSLWELTAELDYDRKIEDVILIFLTNASTPRARAANVVLLAGRNYGNEMYPHTAISFYRMCAHL